MPRESRSEYAANTALAQRSHPTFTRQHFEVIADVMHRARTGVMRTGNGHVLAQFDAFFTPAVADELAETNANFNRRRFIDAVEYGGR